MLFRSDSKDFNKKSLESLIKAGVFDSLEERNKLLENLEDILTFNREIRKSKTNNQVSLFDIVSISVPNLTLKPATEAKTKDRLLWEKDLLGLYISSHPLENLKEMLQRRTIPLRELKQEQYSRQVRVGGIISSIKKILTKNGKNMAFLILEDLTDKAEVVIFPTVLESNPDLFQENKIIMISGKTDSRDGEPKIIANSVEEIITQEI